MNRVLAHCNGAVAVQVVFFKPAGAHDDWSKTGLWRSAEMIPGVTVCEDLKGAQAAEFGSTTSGHVFLYDKQGRLLFNGGITAGRGHVGDSAGENALIAILAGQNADQKQTSVYGCSLLEQCPQRAEALQ